MLSKKFNEKWLPTNYFGIYLDKKGIKEIISKIFRKKYSLQDIKQKKSFNVNFNHRI